MVDSVTRLQLPAGLVIPFNQLSHNLSPLKDFCLISTLFTEIVCMDKAPLSTTAKCMKDYYGEFVVHQAAIEGRLKLIKYLHRQGIKLNLKDRDGQTPILLAALRGHWNIVYYLHANIGHKKEKSRKIENSLHWSTVGKHFSRVL